MEQIVPALDCLTYRCLASNGDGAPEESRPRSHPIFFLVRPGLRLNRRGVRSRLNPRLYQLSPRSPILSSMKARSAIVGYGSASLRNVMISLIVFLSDAEAPGFEIYFCDGSSSSHAKS